MGMLKMSVIISSLYVCMIIKTTVLFSVVHKINYNNNSNNNKILC